MSAPAPKGYQREAVNNALEIFRYAEGQLRQSLDDASNATATAFNGCLLLEAPTGSGKTLMAGMIAEAFAAPDRDSKCCVRENSFRLQIGASLVPQVIGLPPRGLDAGHLLQLGVNLTARKTG